MRRANIGLYTDRMVLSVQESVQEGSYCLLRRQVQEDFLNEQGSLDVDKTVQAATFCKKSAWLNVSSSIIFSLPTVSVSGTEANLSSCFHCSRSSPQLSITIL